MFENKLFRFGTLNLITVLVFFVFIANAPISYFLPLLRLAMALFLAVLIVRYANHGFFKHSNQNSLIVTFILTAASFTVLLSYVSPMESVKGLYFYISILLALLIYKKIDLLISLIKILIVINFVALLWEFNHREYLFLTDQDYPFIIGRYKGLFGYSKEAGAFLLFSVIIIARRAHWIFILVAFLSALLCGSRTAMLGISTIIFIEFCIYFFGRFRYSFWKAVGVGLTAIIIFIVVTVISFGYLSDNQDIFLRILASFDMGSSSHQARLYYWTEHLRIISDYNFAQFIFGYFGYSEAVIGNGTESTYIELLSNGGVIALTLYLVPLAYLSSKSVLNFKKYYFFLVILVLMQVGRIGMGWVDGIILWVYIFHTLKKTYFEKSLQINCVNADREKC